LSREPSAISFALKNADLAVTLTDRAGHHTMICGYQRWVESTTKLSSQHLHIVAASDPLCRRITASAAVFGENSLSMSWRFLETARAENVTCTFLGDEIQRRSIADGG
jgi:hypothetical protein